MIHHLILFQTLPHVNENDLGQMMISTRMSLMKIPEISGLRCGKNVDTQSPWKFFIALETDNLERLKQARKDAIYIKFLSEIISPSVSEQFVATYEMEAGKSIQLS